MKKTSIVRLIGNTQSQHFLLELLKMLDSFYTPAISSLVDLEQYSLKLIENAKVFYVFLEKNVPIGLLAIYTNNYDNRTAFISSFGIMPKYQGTGIATELILHAFNIAISDGMDSVSLEVSNKNKRAYSFYKRHGFYEIERKGDTCLLYRELC